MEPKDGNGGFAVDFVLEFALLSRLGCYCYFGVLLLPFFSPISLGNACSLLRIARRVHTRACLIQETPNTASSFFFSKYLIAPWRRLFRYLHVSTQAFRSTSLPYNVIRKTIASCVVSTTPMKHFTLSSAVSVVRNPPANEERST